MGLRPKLYSNHSRNISDLYSWYYGDFNLYLLH